MKKRLKVVSIVTASVMGLLAMLLCFASPVTKNYVNRHGKDLIGRKVQVDKVKVNALSGRLILFGVEVMEEEDTVLFLEIDTVDVKIALLKLLSHNLEMRHAFVTGLKVNILQDGNHFNFSSIIDHFASQKDPLASHSTSKKWRLGFDDIRLRHWKVSYKDLQRKSQWDLSDVNLLIPGIYFNSDRNTGAGLELEMAGGGSLTTKLDYNMQSNHFNLTLKVNDFAISSAKVYLDDAMQLERLDGTLAGELKAIGNLSELLKTKVTGSLDLKNFAMSNTNGQEMWGAKSVLVKIKEMNLDALNVDIEKVVIDGARSHFCRYKEGNSYNAFFVADKKQSDDNRQATVEARKKEKKKTKMLVRTLTISNGHFIFDDNALADGFSFQIININIKAKNITQNGAENALLTADLPHGGTATLRFQGKMKDYKERSLVALNVSKLQLRDLSPYGVTYLAYPFTDGILTFNSKNTIEAGYIDGNNHFDVINPEIGERRNDIDSAKHLPLKAILYMLKDKNGRVKLDVPVSGKLDDPKFNYWKSIWKTLGNLLIKMASTPFNNISNALGINANELQFIPLDPMAKDFTNEQYKKLSDLARIARYDSSMVIILAQQINADAEDEMLAMAEQRNERARIYMMQLGVKPGQIMILTQPDLTNVNKIGYKVDSELRSPDNEE